MALVTTRTHPHRSWTNHAHPKGASLKFSAKILDNFAYEFDRGDRIGIVGGNGVGKTTFLNVLMGIQPLDSGEVKTGGTVRYSKRAIRRVLWFVSCLVYPLPPLTCSTTAK